MVGRKMADALIFFCPSFFCHPDPSFRGALLSFPHPKDNP